MRTDDVCCLFTSFPHKIKVHHSLHSIPTAIVPALQIKMKFSSALTLTSIAGSANAFVPLLSKATPTSMRMSEIEMPFEAITEETFAEPEPTLPEMSQSLPFMKRPDALTGALAGDVGFDPLGFAKTEADLMNYREAEIKHGRLAMLAAAGWPISEVFDKKIAAALHMTPLLDANDRVPSVLNGGLGKVSPAYWILCLGAAAAVDFYGINKSKSNDPAYFPGNLGFDPLGAYPKNEDGKEWMQLAEIKNGRLAMIAVFGFAIQEAISSSGVVDETPLFFFPLTATLKAYANSGYIH